MKREPEKVSSGIAFLNSGSVVGRAHVGHRLLKTPYENGCFRVDGVLAISDCRNTVSLEIGGATPERLQNGIFKLSTLILEAEIARDAVVVLLHELQAATKKLPPT